MCCAEHSPASFTSASSLWVLWSISFPCFHSCRIAEFDRSTDATAKDLDRLWLRLRRLKQTRGILVTTPEAIKSLMLKCVVSCRRALLRFLHSDTLICCNRCKLLLRCCPSPSRRCRLFAKTARSHSLLNSATMNWFARLTVNRLIERGLLVQTAGGFTATHHSNVESRRRRSGSAR